MGRARTGMEETVAVGDAAAGAPVGLRQGANSPQTSLAEAHDRPERHTAHQLAGSPVSS